MPKERVYLVGSHNQRSIDGQQAITLGQDQRFVNCTFDVVKNPVTGKSTIYLEKRPGFSQQSLVSAGNISTGLIRTDILGTVVSAFGMTTSTIYDGTTSVGAITGEAISFWETSLGGVGYVMIRSSDGTGWYYASDAATTLTYTGTTHTNATLDSLGSTAGMYSGQLVSKADIPAGTRILSVDSGTSVTLNANASGSSTGTVTKTPIAKILDADFVSTGVNKSGFVDLDGYLVYCAEDGYVYHSNINTVQLYSAADKIAANSSADLPIAIAKQDEKIICFGNASTEIFHNAGNASGSVLSKYGNPKNVGVQNQRSLAQLEDDIYFVSSSREGDLHVKKLSHLQISQVSTPAIDKIIGTANATGSAIYLSAFSLGGYFYLLVQVCSSVVTGTNYFILAEDSSRLLLETGDKFILEADQSATTGLTRELIFNINLNIWSEWDSNLLTFVKGIGSGSTNQIIASSRINTSGKIYGINPSADTEVYADDGTAYTMKVQTSSFDLGTDALKFVSQIDLIADIEPGGTATLECNDYDFDPTKWETLGTFDMTQKVKRITRCGSHRGGRAYRLTHSDNYPFRGSALDITYKVGV